ncbi:LutC/YkgG family protein [Phycicoccus duodecadis]|uniref:L-lactate dehydrogenase complex protein LldG n=1 Tax=Phycicoccus duodecadis TaxID=173053 RepID=A0A2N3YLV2_9MICO|nr:lactate utilization protein C [Phycicoccus duodecadis]PKW27833.1 L-lactate dehydrogenase complex protein LldG [Phycicoccus duodecadis]
MSARDDVLAAVRAALGPERRPAVEVDRAYRGRDPLPAGAGVVDLFVERVEDYRATVTRCTAADLVDAVAQALGGAARVVVPDGLDLDVPGAVPDDALTATALDAVDAVVTRATLGIAETGTVVLDHGPGQGRRALSLVPDLHVCVVEAGQVVRGVTDAVARLDPVRPQTWVSGPSATSDIELDRVEGVHGPRRLHVVLVEG